MTIHWEADPAARRGRKAETLIVRGGDVMNAMKLLIVGALALSIFMSANPSGANVVTSLPDGTLIPMPELAWYEGVGPQTFGPNIIWTSTDPSAVFGWLYGAEFHLNGIWLPFAVAPHLGPTSVMSNPNQTMTFRFNTPVQAVGGFFNYSYWEPNATTFTIAVYDSSRNLIESTPISFTTGGGNNTGFFYGFQEERTNIRYFEVTGKSAIGFTNLTVCFGDPIPVNPAIVSLLLLD
jgi:hypothetical protein